MTARSVDPKVSAREQTSSEKQNDTQGRSTRVFAFTSAKLLPDPPGAALLLLGGNGGMNAGMWGGRIPCPDKKKREKREEDESGTSKTAT